MKVSFAFLKNVLIWAKYLSWTSSLNLQILQVPVWCLVSLAEPLKIPEKYCIEEYKRRKEWVSYWFSIQDHTIFQKKINEILLFLFSIGLCSNKNRSALQCQLTCNLAAKLYVNRFCEKFCLQFTHLKTHKAQHFETFAFEYLVIKQLVSDFFFTLAYSQFLKLHIGKQKNPPCSFIRYL